MPPKKKEAKAAANADPNAPDPELLEWRNKTLELQLRERTEDIALMRESKLALEKEAHDLTHAYHQNRGATMAMTSEMTGQFEGMQIQLVDKIALLQRTVGDLKEELVEAETRHVDTERSKDAKIAEKDAEVP